RAAHGAFLCPRCGRLFRHGSNLTRHLNAHRGLRAHACGLCGKSFTQGATLRDHLNLHSGARPH
ncbi:ZBT12 protein, partial [Eudromia elegans]|nr:ZBT12 protein [Eudromia elegans]